MAENNGQQDWTNPRCWIEGEPTLTAGLKKKKAMLEEVVKPSLVSRGTGPIVLFRGKQRHLGPCDQRTHLATLTLQCLYAIEEALQCDDIEKAVGAAVAFGQVEAKLSSVECFGTSGIEAAAEVARRLANLGLINDEKRSSGRAKLKREAEEAIAIVKQEYPDRQDDDDFIKIKAGKKLGIQKRQVNKRLSF